MLSGFSFYLSQYGQSYFSYFVFQYFCLVSLFGLIAYFFYAHLMLILFNQSTIEYSEKNREHKFKSERNFYDISMYENLKQILGPVYLWLIPINSHSKFDGYEFPYDNDKLTFYKKKALEKMLQAKNEKENKDNNRENRENNRNNRENGDNRDDREEQEN